MRRASITGGPEWVAVAALLGLSSIVPYAVAMLRDLPLGDIHLDWQPMFALAEPWRWWTAAAVHFSTQHLAINLVGAVIVAVFGVLAHVPPRMAVAWLIAWPLTQLGLLLRPDLLHYGGLSGVLHAGVAIAALQLIVAGRRRPRLIGAAVLLGLVAKVLMEKPWGAAVRRVPGWDIGIAPVAHASGLVAGLLCAGVALGIAWLIAHRSAPRTASA